MNYHNGLKLISLIAIFYLTCFSAGAQQKSQKAGLTVAFYNVENLFDTVDDPAIIDEEYLPTSDLKWDNERYQAKLKALSRVIDTLGGIGGPDVLGMCEVENRAVLEDLVKHPMLAAKGYEIVHKNSPDARGIDVAFLYKKSAFKVLNNNWLRVRVPSDTGFKTRDILVATGVYVKNGKDTKDTISFMVNHFPSRRGGQEASTGKRLFVAELARKQVDEFLAKNRLAKVVLMGDFNDEPIDSSIRYTLAAGPREEVGKTVNGRVALYNAMFELKAQKRGTHFYRSEFSMLDQMLLSAGTVSGKGLKLVGAGNIYNPRWMQQTDAKYDGAPNRTFVGKRYFGGFSDHFPVFIRLEE